MGQAPEMRHPGIRDLGVLEVQQLQSAQPLQMCQPFVSDSGTAQLQPREAPLSIETGQTLAGDLCTRAEKALESAEVPDRSQYGIRLLRLHIGPL